MPDRDFYEAANTQERYREDIDDLPALPRYDALADRLRDEER